MYINTTQRVHEHQVLLTEYTYRVAPHVGHAIAPEDDDLVVVRRQNIGLGGIVDPRVVVEHLAGGPVVALPRDLNS
jgi:hypothetical protein